jgi:ABC-type Fe3+-hydroxamate transport system substrate-binding protein
MISVTDATGNLITLTQTAQRIISLVPSQTELLHDLGLDAEVPCITKFCVHPPSWRREKTIVGGTKQLKLDLIASLTPDLIIGNKEENTETDIRWLAERFPTFITDVADVDGAYQMIEDIGVLTGMTERAMKLKADITQKFHALTVTHTRHSAIYLIWQEPYMTIGGDTFISDMMQLAGFENLFKQQQRYPQVTIEQMNDLNPDFLLLSSEPFPFKPEHAADLQAQLQNTQVVLVDGEMFSWYGSRMLLAADYFRALREQIAPRKMC